MTVAEAFVRSPAQRIDSRYIVRILRVVSVAEFKLKYAGSALGYVWSIIKPLAWFSVLFVVFGRFFRLQGGFQHYAVYLLTGIVTWTFFLDGTSLALESFVLRASVLRKLSFPRIVIPIAATITTGLTFAANCLVVAVFVAIERLSPRPEWLLLPLLVLEIYAFILVIGVILATLYVRIRDLKQLWELALQLMFFASPIIYPVGFLPRWAQKVAFASPLVQAIQDVRAILIPQNEAITAAHVYGSRLGYAVPLGTCLVFAVIAARLFRRQDPYLAERT
jgi:ABC-2 type transport system permease protein